MTGDPLYRPLQGRTPKRRGGAGLMVALGLTIAVAIGIGGTAWLVVGHPGDGPAVAIVPIEPVAPRPPVAAAPAPSAAPEVPGSPSSGPTILANGDTVEVQHGVKIIRMGSPPASRGVVPAEQPAASSAAAQELAPAPDARVMEPTELGDLPRIGADGVRPADVYARPIQPMAVSKAGFPRVALLVGDSPDEADAIGRRLPGEVSLAFRSDAAGVAAQVARARQAGHEVFLELSGGVAAPWPSGAGLVEALHREMGRFTGYVGVTTPEGDGLPIEAQAVVDDLRGRGLLFLDSATGLEAAGSPLDPRYARPDVAIDGRLATTSITAALAQLESVARVKGRAIGYVGHLADADVIANFAASLDAKGLMLVPVSALVPALSSGSAAQNSP